MLNASDSSIPGVPVYAFASLQGSRGDLLTADSDEAYQIANLHQKEWRGGQCGWVSTTPAKGTVAVLRYLNSKSQDHFYTTDPNEGDQAAKYLDYHAEGTSFHLFPTVEAATPYLPAGGIVFPFYRWVKGSYHYYWTESRSSGGGPAVPVPPSGATGARYEGVLGYAISSPDAPLFAPA